MNWIHYQDANMNYDWKEKKNWKSKERIYLATRTGVLNLGFYDNSVINISKLGVDLWLSFHKGTVEKSANHERKGETF